MGPQLWGCVTLIGRYWYGGLSAIPVLFGALKEMGIGPAAIPAFVWWVAAILILLGAALKMAWDFQRERSAWIKPGPDMTLDALVQRIVGSTDMSQSGVITSTGVAFEQIRDRAARGEIASFGVHSTFMGGSVYGPRIPIPMDHWVKYGIDVLKFFQHRGGHIGPNSGAAIDSHFSAIEFNRGQIDVYWPQRRKWGFTFRCPIAISRLG